MIPILPTSFLWEISLRTNEQTNKPGHNLRTAQIPFPGKKNTNPQQTTEAFYAKTQTLIILQKKNVEKKKKQKTYQKIPFIREPIPEETYTHSKSLCEPTGDDWNYEGVNSSLLQDHDGSSTSEKLFRSGRQPLLPKLTPRAQIKRFGSKNAVTTALLSSHSSITDSDIDEEEDIDVYDDDMIVMSSSDQRPPRPLSSGSRHSLNRSNSSTGADKGKGESNI